MQIMISWSKWKHNKGSIKWRTLGVSIHIYFIIVLDLGVYEGVLCSFGEYHERCVLDKCPYNVGSIRVWM